jgi:hypothetical protein
MVRAGGVAVVLSTSMGCGVNVGKGVAVAVCFGEATSDTFSAGAQAVLRRRITNKTAVLYLLNILSSNFLAQYAFPH